MVCLELFHLDGAGTYPQKSQVCHLLPQDRPGPWGRGGERGSSPDLIQGGLCMNRKVSYKKRDVLHHSSDKVFVIKQLNYFLAGHEWYL